jgi:hypothetical protein
MIRRSREIPSRKEAFSRERMPILMGPCSDAGAAVETPRQWRLLLRM